MVLCLHSYAGIPSSSGVEDLHGSSRTKAGKDTAVIGILYVAAFILLPADSARSVMIHHDTMPEPFKSGNPGGYMGPIPAEFAPMVYNDLTDQEEIKRYHGMMVLHSSDAYSGQMAPQAGKT